MLGGSSPAAARRRNPARTVLFACVLVLLVSQALIGSLSVSALHRLADQNTHERVGLLARQVGADIQAGLNLGKPLAQYFGLSQHLQAALAQLPNGGALQVILADGHRVEQAADTESPTGSIRVDVPLKDRSGVQGVLRVLARPAKVGLHALLASNLRVLGATTGLALAALILMFRLFMPVHQLAAAGRMRLLAPLCVMLLAQGAYAAYTVQSFKSVWLGVARENASLLGQRLQADFHRLLDYGIEPGRWVGAEKILAHQAAAFPLVKALVIASPTGKPLYAADANGVLASYSLPPGLGSGANDVRFPLRRTKAQEPDAWLYVQLDGQQIRQGVWQRVVDAATVVVVALVATVELLLLLTLLIDRAFAVPVAGRGGFPQGLDDISRIGSVVRPVMFGFMFAVALPLSFIPLHARSLLGGSGHFQSLQMAWPVAIEMGCGLLTALLAGRLIDRRGWPVPVLAGLLVTAIAGVLAALSQSLEGFVAARALCGLGYGLAWMGLQGFIVVASPAAERGRNMAIVIAGLFAGHLSGAAVGALLAEQIGRPAVFALGACLLALPALGVRALMWPYRKTGNRHSGTVPVSVAHSWHHALGLLLSRDYGLLLAASIIPFSVAQVGLLSFALPLYMEQAGASTASTGRVLMAYGLCVIYLAPWVARRADRSRSRKPWIVAGGVCGSLGLISLYLANSVSMATLAVIMLALASCLAGGAQAAYMLSLAKVQAFGAASATSLMRAGDKLGQMIGPLLVGALLVWAGISFSLALVGCLYLLATLLFWLWAPSDHSDKRS